jgi:hypothetical protein
VTGDVSDSALVWARANSEGGMQVEFWAGAHRTQSRSARRETTIRIDGKADFVGNADRT